MIRASAPGSVMITGEHAVVYGHKAIVAAIEQRIFVTLTPRDDRQVQIQSEIADPLISDLDDLASGGPYRFLLAAIHQHRSEMATGFDLSVTSEINPTLGLGSSAAVTVAGLGAILTYLGKDLTPLHAMAHQIVLDIQGRGSGADLAASLTGGMIAYQTGADTTINPLPAPPALSLKYCGYKTPTAEVLKQIAARMAGHEAEFEALYARMGAEAETAITAAETSDWAVFAASLTAYQQLMEELGVCDQTLATIIREAQANPATLAAKISGSGLGDCVLALGAVPDGFTPAKLATKGLLIDA